MIDLVLAGDNAVAVGLAAAGLAPDQRKKAILIGLIAAVVAAHRLRPDHHPAAGHHRPAAGRRRAAALGLLEDVARAARAGARTQAEAEAALEKATGVDSTASPAPSRAGRQAQDLPARPSLQILIADVSMSLDNVLAVAGAAREHPGILVFGLILSIALMGVAAHLDRQAAAQAPLDRLRRPGHRALRRPAHDLGGPPQVVVDLGTDGQYNASMPAFLDIAPEEAADHRRHAQADAPAPFDKLRSRQRHRQKARTIRAFPCGAERSDQASAPPKRSVHSATCSSSILREQHLRRRGPRGPAAEPSSSAAPSGVGQAPGSGSPRPSAIFSAANGMNGAETCGEQGRQVQPVRTTTAARSRSVLIAVQGAASCRYSLPSTQSGAQRLGRLADLDGLHLGGELGQALGRTSA